MHRHRNWQETKAMREPAAFKKAALYEQENL